jgi:hypothetical protein
VAGERACQGVGVRVAQGHLAAAARDAEGIDFDRRGVGRVTGFPREVQELRVLQAHLAFLCGRLDDARAISGSLPADDDLRLPYRDYRDRVRLSVLDGRLMILSGRVEEGIGLLRRLGLHASETRNVDLAADVRQSLAQALAEPRLPRPPGSADTAPYSSGRDNLASL